MIYREAGIYRSTYAADMAIFPLALDRIVVGVVVVVAFGVIRRSPTRSPRSASTS